MATVTTNDQHYADIAAAIRAKNETTDQYLPSQMAAAIAALETGGDSMTVKTGTVTYSSLALQTLDTGLADVTYFMMYSNYHSDGHTYGIEMIVYDATANRSWASVKDSSSTSYRTYLSNAVKKTGGVLTLGSTLNGAYKPQVNVSHKWIAFGQ